MDVDGTIATVIVHAPNRIENIVPRHQLALTYQQIFQQGKLLGGQCQFFVIDGYGMGLDIKEKFTVLNCSLPLSHPAGCGGKGP